MNELLADAKTVVLGLLALLMSLLTFMGRRGLKRLDAIEAAQETYITRTELTQTLLQMRDDRLRMHEENRADLQYIRTRVDSISDRQTQ